MTLYRLGEADRAEAVFKQLVEVMKESPSAIKKIHEPFHAEASEVFGRDIELEKEEEP